MTQAEIERYDPSEGKQGFALATKVDNVIWVSGMVGARKDQTVPEDLGEQVTQAYKNIEDVLSQYGAGLDRVVNETIFVVGDAAKLIRDIGRPRAAAYGDAVTAATLVGVTSLIDDRYKIEIAVQAVL